MDQNPSLKGETNVSFVSGQVAICICVCMSYIVG